MRAVLSEPRAPGDESGIILITLLATVIPLLLLVGAAATTMISRNNQLLADIHIQKALLAAESGVDRAVYLANTTGLASGVQFVGNLGGGMTYTGMPVDLGSDGVDNDGDTDVDEPDEDMIEVTVTGRFGRAVRRIAAYLEPISALPLIQAAAEFQDPDFKAKNKGSTSYLVSGFDTNLDGSPGPGAATHAIAVPKPATAADVISRLKYTPGSGNIIGKDGDASIGIMDQVTDWSDTIASVKANADIVVPKGTKYTDVKLGDSSTGDWKVVYVPDGVEFHGNSGGAGILFVEDGWCEGFDNFEWHGVIIAVKGMRFNGNTVVRGATSANPHTWILDNTQILYSSEAIRAVKRLVPSPGGNYLLVGWRVISNN